MPALGLSYAAAGTLAMCFQMANSVSQLGFGALADRWRPRVLVMAGPLAAVIILSLRRTGDLAVHARCDPRAGWIRRGRLSSAGRRAGLPDGRSPQGPRDVGAPLGRLARVLVRAGTVRAVHRGDGPAVVAADHDPGPGGAVVHAAACAGDAFAAGARAIDVGHLAARGRAAHAALFHHRVANGHLVRLHDLRAAVADRAGLHDRRSEHGRVALPVYERHWRDSSAGRSRIGSGRGA